ncbi:acyl-CoA dehydrogenase family protein [Corallococcus llansteffanensis]|uniref:acyl-CoA dehydrogenase family protein n=1 Tax=Corallococcus llansteffanensis TaxID=2316731 RepID=UPI00131543CA|nr:acyl-CoA dehydrogenase family protein [Corallococcus llansteffanensis]
MPSHPIPPPSTQQWAEELERRLGSPWDEESPLSLARGARLDEEERFPQEAIQSLHALGLPEFYIPTEYGGRFESYEQLLLLARLLARRDLTVTVSSSTLAWSTLTWLGGTDAQKRRQAAFLRAGHSPCLAYSEEAHGADLLSGATTARRVAGGYRITGEKWPINRATRGEGYMVLARTDPLGGPRGLSLFMLDKAQLEPGTHAPLPRVPTVGVRGCDISGVRFTDCLARDDDRLGPEGGGLELALKALHITRALCSGLALGAADTGLRTTLNLARGRRLYGDTVFAIPSVSRACADSFLDGLVADAVAQTVLRGVHVAPERFAAWSAIAKYFVPSLSERAFQRLTAVQGARFYMRDRHDWGAFQRFYRDNLLIGIFDGSAPVNLHSLGLQLRALCQGTLKGTGVPDLDARLENLFTLSQRVPPLDPQRLDLVARGPDEVFLGLPDAVQRLEGQVGHLDESHRGVLLALARCLIKEQGAHAQAVLQLATRAGRAFATSPELFDLARRYAVLFSAASCLHLWVRNARTQGGFFEAGAWLILALSRLLREAGSLDAPEPPPGLYDSLTSELVRRHDARQLFSLQPLQVA